MTFRVAPLVFLPSEAPSAVAVASYDKRSVGVLRAPNQDLPGTSDATRALLEQRPPADVDDLIGAEITNMRCYVDLETVKDFDRLAEALTYADRLLILAVGGREPRDDVPDDVRDYLSGVQHRFAAYGTVLERLLNRVHALESELGGLHEELRLILTRPITLADRYSGSTPEADSAEASAVEEQTPLATLQLGSRIENALTSAVISTVEQLAATPPAQMRDLKGIGRDSLRLVDAALEQVAPGADAEIALRGRVERATPAGLVLRANGSTYLIPKTKIARVAPGDEQRSAFDGLEVAGLVSKTPHPDGFSGTVDHLLLMEDKERAARLIREGVEYAGVVTNVTQYGVFVDIGLAVGLARLRAGAVPPAAWSRVTVRVIRVSRDGKLDLAFG